MEHKSQSFFFSSIASWRPCLFARLASLAAFFWALRFARASASSLDDEAIVTTICSLFPTTQPLDFDARLLPAKAARASIQ